MFRYIRYLLFGFLASALMSCGPNEADISIHPEIVKMRVMLEHGFNGDDLNKEVRTARLNYELHKSELSKNVISTLGDSLDALEILIAIPSFLQNDTDLNLYYDQLHRLGVYTSKSQFDKENSRFVTNSKLMQIQDPTLENLTTELDTAILKLMLDRIKRVALEDLRKAEEASLK